ncbi:hypothetical protein E1H18_1766 [Caulobacter sp. RHG1]|nr:hypothetical protein [Caulobacter sp. RHG1]
MTRPGCGRGEDRQGQPRASVDPADDLPFGAAINCALAVIDAVHSLIWSRSNGHKAD